MQVCIAPYFGCHWPSSLHLGLAYVQLTCGAKEVGWAYRKQSWLHACMQAPPANYVACCLSAHQCLALKHSHLPCRRTLRPAQRRACTHPYPRTPPHSNNASTVSPLARLNPLVSRPVDVVGDMVAITSLVTICKWLALPLSSSWMPERSTVDVLLLTERTTPREAGEQLLAQRVRLIS